jgi:hypothetical protein
MSLGELTVVLTDIGDNLAYPKENGLVRQYLIFVSDTVHQERLTTNGITDTNRKELKDF